MTRLTLADLPARYQAQVTALAKMAPGRAPAPVGKPMLRQSAAPALNKTEAAFWDILVVEHPFSTVLAQELTLKIANGCRYTPDFAVVNRDGAPTFFEVKGHMRDDAAVKIKVAAAQFPAWAFWLVWRKAGQWQQQRVLA